MSNETRNEKDQEQDPAADARDCSSPNPLVAGLAAAAVKKRVRELGNRVNELFLEILWPGSWDNQEDAYDALIACCMKALDGLFYRKGMVGAEGSSVWDIGISGIRASTIQFIVTTIDKFIDDHKKLSPDEIATLALKKHLGFVAKAVHDKLVDHLRHAYAEERRIDKADASRLDPLVGAAILRATVSGLKKRLLAELGNRPFETLRALVERYPFAANKRQGKGNSTRIIAGSFRISEQQARSRKHALLEAGRASGSDLVQKLVEQALAGTFVSEPDCTEGIL